MEKVWSLDHEPMTRSREGPGRDFVLREELASRSREATFAKVVVLSTSSGGEIRPGAIGRRPGGGGPRQLPSGRRIGEGQAREETRGTRFACSGFGADAVEELLVIGGRIRVCRCTPGEIGVRRSDCLRC